MISTLADMVQAVGDWLAAGTPPNAQFVAVAILFNIGVNMIRNAIRMAMG